MGVTEEKEEDGGVEVEKKNSFFSPAPSLLLSLRSFTYISPFFPFSLSFAPSLCNRAAPSLSWRPPRRERDGRLRVRPARGRPDGRSERNSSGDGGGRSGTGSGAANDNDGDDGFGWGSIRPSPVAPAASGGPFRRHGE